MINIYIFIFIFVNVKYICLSMFIYNIHTLHICMSLNTNDLGTIRYQSKDNEQLTLYRVTLVLYISTLILSVHGYITEA